MTASALVAWTRSWISSTFPRPTNVAGSGFDRDYELLRLLLGVGSSRLGADGCLQSFAFRIIVVNPGETPLEPGRGQMNAGPPARDRSEPLRRYERMALELHPAQARRGSGNDGKQNVGHLVLELQHFRGDSGLVVPIFEEDRFQAFAGCREVFFRKRLSQPQA